MKKFLKVIAVLAGLLVLAGVIGLILVLKALPSPAQIGESIRPSSVKTALKQARKEEREKQVGAQAPSTSPAPAPSVAPPASEGGQTVETEEDKKLLDDLMDDHQPLANVCASLVNASKSELNGYSFKEFGQRYRDSVLGTEAQKDPLIQSIKPTLRYVFADPNMKDLIAEAEAAANRGEESSLMDKAGFYGKAYAAYRDMLANKGQIQNIMDRSYHLMIMSKVIAKRPELASDDHVQTYCHSIESALNGNNPTSFAEEREEFNKFMAYSGVDPKSVGYDPNYRTRLQVHLGKSGLHLGGGWMDSLVKPSPEELKAIQDQVKDE